MKIWKLKNPQYPQPEYINGHRVRRGMVTCPVCAAPPDKWCAPDCNALDMMDYR